MNKNDWIKKYLESYNEKKGTNKTQSDLSDREKAVADALYAQYQKERIAEGENKLEKSKIESEKEISKKVVDQKGGIAKKGVKEDLLLRGNNTLEGEKSVLDRVESLEAKGEKSVENKSKEGIEKLDSQLSTTLRKYKEDGSEKVDRINSTYDKKEEVAYNKAVKELDRIKESKWIKDFLYQRGTKEEMTAYLDKHKGELGNKYDELKTSVDSIEEYSSSASASKKHEIKVGDDTIIMTDKEYSLINAVKYEKNAGLIVTYGDNFVVSYNGNEYKIQGGNKIDGSLKRVVEKLATTREGKLSVGDVIYYNNKLYVYATDNTFRECVNRGKSVSADSLDSLLKVLFIEKERIENEDEQQ